jgi:uncharacterized repeat protein (TIGR01451 family)
MRRAIIGSVCLAMTGILVTAVWGKEEPGSRATFGQKVSSLFGLIDRGENAPPPPPPPGMPSIYGKRTTPAGTNRGYAGTTSNQNRPTGIPHGGTPLPPPPQRTESDAAEVSDFPAEQNLPSNPPQMPRPSALLQSRQGSAVNRTPSNAGAGTTSSGGNTGAMSSGGNSAPQFSPLGAVRNAPPSGGGSTTISRSPSATASAGNVAPQASPPQTPPQAVPLSRPAAATPPPVVSSRRRPQGNAAAALPAPSGDSAAGLSTAPPTANSSTGSEPFVPTTPFGNPAPAAPTTAPVMPSVASSVPPPTSPTAPASVPLATASPLRPTSSASGTPGVPMMSSGSTPTGGSGVLASFQSPEITVETVGPKRIAVGREAEYRLQIRNRGASAAHELSILLTVPPSAEVVSLNGSTGHDASAADRTAGEPMRWQIDVLPGQSQEDITLVLVPRKNETFDLGVRWTCSPPAAVATIEVEEPQLQMAIAGPTEVSFGEQRLYKLSVSNPGNGTAEEVVLHLLPLLPTDGEPVRHAIGKLKAGETTSVEVELTARQAGQVKIRTAATAAGNLKAEASTDVVVRRAALDVATSGPRTLFAGVPATYEVRLRNTGDDVAKNVRLSFDLPSGAKLLSTTPTAAGEPKSGPIVWTFERVPAGAEQVCTIKCSIDHGGVQQFTLSAQADGDLRKTVQSTTDVQAVADLALDVVDTAGPVAVGQPVTYEIKVRNRGMKSAEAVDVVAFFSDGIEPEKAEGQTYDLQPGMVVFKPLPTVGANQEKVLKVTARATAAGTHRLRVELRSAAPQTQLSHEDSTLFYADDAPATAKPTTAPATFTPPAGPIRQTGTFVVPQGVPSGTTSSYTSAAAANAPAVKVAPYVAPNTLR